MSDRAIAAPHLNATVHIEDDPSDDPKDVVLCGEIGRVLWDAYPGYAWRVEIPPHQNIIIIRNLDCDPKGRMGMVIYKDQLDVGRNSVVRAAGEFLERYRMRRGRLDGDDLASRQMIFEKPDT